MRGAAQLSLRYASKHGTPDSFPVILCICASVNLKVSHIHGVAGVEIL